MPSSRKASGAVWEADVLPVNATIAESPGSRVGMVMIMAGGEVLTADPVTPMPTGVDGLAAALADRVRALAAQAVPREIRVRHAELAKALAQSLAGTGSLAAVQVSVVPHLPALEAAAADLLAHLGAGSPAPRAGNAPTWAAWGLPRATVRELFAAAAQFYRAAPWRSVADDQLVYADLPYGDTWGACVLGQSGEGFGLALYADPQDYFALHDRDRPGGAFSALQSPVLSLLFSPQDELERVARKEILAAGWEVAGHAGYPQLITLNTPGGGVSAEQARLLTTLLRLVPRFVGQYRAALEAPESPRWPLEWRDDESGIALMYEGRAGDEGNTIFGPITTLACALPVGLGARPAEALAPEADRVAGDLAIMGRYSEHLARSGLKRATVTRHLLAAAAFVAFLDQAQGASLASATEFDLRVFLYDRMPRAGLELPPASLRGVPGSLLRLVRYLREHEGLDYPWADPILRDRKAFELRLDSFLSLPGLGAQNDEELDDLWRGTLVMDLDARALLPADHVPGGVQWTRATGPLAEPLRRELARRWLLWRDELLQGGIAGPHELRIALEQRQLAWEQAPHPAEGGRTPIELLRRKRKRR
jgi:hypothetical protein